MRRLSTAIAAFVLLTVGCTAEVSFTAETAGQSGSEPSEETPTAEAADPQDATESDQQELESAGQDSADPESSETTQYVASGEPTKLECEFDFPLTEPIECYMLTVPEDYAEPDGTQIELAIAVIPSNADGNPTIYLEGGPGGHAIDTLPLIYDDRYKPLLELGDVIVYDQRGIGRSTPVLDCPEMDEADRAIVEAKEQDVEILRETIAGAAAACSDRLTSEGIGLDHYNSEHNAHDVAAIADAFGADQLNLFGISYGTRLGFEVQRFHPDLVDRAVFDSTLSPEVDDIAAAQESIVASYELAIGDLDPAVRELYEELEAEPLDLAGTNFLTLESEPWLVDGDALMGVITQMLYDPMSIDELPDLIGGLQVGDTSTLEFQLDLITTNGEFFTPAALYSVACHDEAPFTSAEAIAEFGTTDPIWVNIFNLYSNVGSFALEFCAAWDSGTAEPVLNEPVAGDWPTLFLAGAFDPVTPPQWAEASAEFLPNSTVVVFDSQSHGVTGDPCGMRLAVDFLADRDLDLSCVS